MKNWFTSDYHFGHANIIKYCNRPFKSIEHMNMEIIRRHNSRVKPDDNVFFLGDFCFKNSEGGKEGEGELTKSAEYLSKLNGRFIFIEGNHDNNNSLKTIIKKLVIEIGGMNINLVHNPIDIDTKYEINFVGHIHEKWKFKRDKIDMINVGCDVWNFMPITFNEIMKEYSDWKKRF